MKIEEVLKKIEGNLLLISNDQKLFDIVTKNKKITESYVLSNSGSNGKSFSLKNKKIHIKNLRKRFNKKSVDNLVVDYELVKNYLNSFVRNSIYLNKGNLYFYNINNKNELIEKYKRYTQDIENKETIKINNSNTKSNIIKDYYYIYLDKKNKLIDKLSDLLTS